MTKKKGLWLLGLYSSGMFCVMIMFVGKLFAINRILFVKKKQLNMML
jgi:hypothetical protein